MTVPMVDKMKVMGGKIIMAVAKMKKQMRERMLCFIWVIVSSLIVQGKVIQIKLIFFSQNEFKSRLMI